ncbi:MAG TPA: hypothetical protein VFU24_06905 [Burkholderiales bacterium]|nr:hypothetical protein [Burkholderiales bacterium]
MSSLARQRGAALMAMLAVLILGAAWWAVTALSTPVDRTASERLHNARILQEAKSALLGYVAHRAAMTTENDPGRLPCPEAAGNIGTANEGIAAGNCTLPAIGRLPWRTLGLDKWRDVAGEPLWYVVSAGWAKPNAATNTVINSSSVGNLTLDATADVVALIIAPGRPLQVSDSAGCTARVQRRTTPSPAIDRRDYLECENATSPADAAFVSTGPADSFNDQVLAVTGAEVLPGIEAAVASRFERQLAPQIRTAYSTGDWPANPALPFAATFANPSSATFKGVAGTFGGLLPASFSETSAGSGVACNPATAGARCDPAFVAWQSAALAGASINSASCTTSATTVDCTFYRRCLIVCAADSMPFTLTATASNVGMALRQLNHAAAMTHLTAAPRSSSGVLNANGSATITLSAEAAVSGGVGFTGALGDLLCGVLALLQVCKEESISVPIGLLADHPVLDPTDATYNWFFRNNWHQVSYYVVAPDIAPSGPRACGASCLTVNFRNPSAGQRGLLVIAGRNLTGAAVAPSDWLEGTNADGDLAYAVRDPTKMVRRTFNDRIAIIDP